MTIQPTLNNILIEFVPPLDGPKSLVVLPDNHTIEPSKEAIIIAVGPGTPTTPMPFKEGQRVLVRRYYDMAVSANGKQYRLTDIESIVAVLS